MFCRGTLYGVAEYLCSGRLPNWKAARKESYWLGPRDSSCCRVVNFSMATLHLKCIGFPGDAEITSPRFR
jgi:hypothetical protein